jgi:hypothetical protein
MSFSTAGDGLVRPLNAPSGNQVLPGVQPGVSGGVVLAQYVIIFGQAGSDGAAPGMFVYSGSPGPGNPPIFSVSNATQDPYGSAIAPGIWSGQFGGTQAGLQVIGNIGQLAFPVAGSSPAAVAGIVGRPGGTGGSVLQVFSAQDAAPNNDQVVLEMADHTAVGAAGATYFLVYQDANGTGWLQMVGGFPGLALQSVSGFTGVLPGTGTSATNAAQPETWHTAALINGWAGSGVGVNGLRYRVVPGGELEIEADIINAGFVPPGNSVCFNLPAGWIPGTTRNRPASWNNPQVNNAASAPWVNVNGAAIQVTGIEAANKEIFFHFWVPI